MFFLITRAHQQVSGLIFQSMNYLMLKLLDSGRQSGITDGIGKMSILGEGKFMKAFLSDKCKEIEENNKMGKTRNLFKKIRDTKGTFHTKMGSIKTEMVWT